MRDNTPRKETNSTSTSSTPIPDGADTSIMSVSDSELETLNDVQRVQSSSIKKYIHSEETTPELGVVAKSEIVTEEGCERMTEEEHEERVIDEESKNEITPGGAITEEVAPEEAVRSDSVIEEVHEETVTDNMLPGTATGDNEAVTHDGTIQPPSEDLCHNPSTVEDKPLHSPSSEITKPVSEKKPLHSSEHSLPPPSTQPPSQPILLLCNVPPLTRIDSSLVHLHSIHDY